MEKKYKIITISMLVILLFLCCTLSVCASSDDDIIIKGGGIGTPTDCLPNDAQCHNSQLPASSSDNLTSKECYDSNLENDFCEAIKKCEDVGLENEKCVYYNEAKNTFGSTGGVRLTIVDSNGDRINGTRSIDLTRKNMHLECGTNCTNLQSSYLKYEMEYGDSVKKENKYQLLTYPDRMNRNEVKQYGIKHGNATSSVQMYYWKNLPWLYNTGDSDALNNFLKNLSAQEYDKIFQLMNYTTYSAWSSSQDVYLQIEPTTYLSLARTENYKVKELDRYYGTVSEVASMIEQANKWIFYYFWTDVFPLSVYNVGYGTIAGYEMFSSTPSPYRFGYETNQYGPLNDEFLSTKGYAIGSWKIKDITQEPCNFDYYSFIPYSCHYSNNALIKDKDENIFSSCMFKANKSELFSNRSSAEQNYIRQYYNPEGSTVFDKNPYCKVVCTDRITYALPTIYPDLNYLVVTAGQRYRIGISGSPSNPELLKDSLNPVKFRSVSTCRTGFAVDEDVPSNAKHGQINYEKFKEDWLKNESDKQALWNDGNYAQYKLAINTGHNMLARLMTCNNFQRTESGFDPKLSYSAEPKNIYNYTYSLKSIVTFDESTTSYYNSSNTKIGTTSWNTSGYKDDTQGFTFSGSNFSNEKDPNINGSYSTLPFYDENHVLSTIKYPTNDWVEQTTNKLIYYTLPDNVYTYKDKSSGISYSSEDEVKQKQHAYSKIGYSNLPIPFHVSFVKPYEKTEDGYLKEYNFAFDYYYSDTNGTTKNLFGTKNRFYNGDFLNVFNPVYKRKFGDTSLTISNLHYECSYKVKSGIITSCPADDPDCNNPNPTPCVQGDPDCPTSNPSHPSSCPADDPNCPVSEDLVAEYRSISLNDPFPGQNGKGRTYGNNWDGKTDKGVSYVDAYIKNNRGVEGDKVYNLEPMYEFVLDSKSIRSIREYNKNHSYDDTINLECDDSGNYCKSKFIKEGIDNNFFKFKNTSGTCFNAYKPTWESCRYTTSETYVNPLLNP